MHNCKLKALRKKILFKKRELLKIKLLLKKKSLLKLTSQKSKISKNESKLQKLPVEIELQIASYVSPDYKIMYLFTNNKITQRNVYHIYSTLEGKKYAVDEVSENDLRKESDRYYLVYHGVVKFYENIIMHDYFLEPKEI